ncbi:hypothetical protein AYI95_03965 [Shewanella xiamenensis]|nr:hypothetical protein AYI95_03965 [Shewanella xiamenensis]
MAVLLGRFRQGSRELSPPKINMSIVLCVAHQHISPFGLVLLLSGSMERKGHNACAKDGNATGFNTRTRQLIPIKKTLIRRLFY